MKALLHRYNVVFLFLSLILLSGCRPELTRIAFVGPGSAEATFTHEGGKLVLWTDLDVSGEDIKAAAWYEVAFYQNGNLIVQTFCDPFDVHVRLKSVRTQTLAGFTAKYMGRMTCGLELPAGETMVQASFFETGGVEVRKADLVVK